MSSARRVFGAVFWGSLSRGEAVTKLRVSPWLVLDFWKFPKVAARGAAPNHEGENLCPNPPASDRLVSGTYRPDQPRARTGYPPPPD